MQQVELTMGRTLKIFWSFIWRAWVLMIPTMIVVFIIAALGFFLTGGISAMRNGNMDPKSMGTGLFAAMYLIFIPLMFAIQTYAMKLALNVRWSDFRLVAVASTGSAADDAHSATASAPQSPTSLT
jgi:hypothetical protein